MSVAWANVATVTVTVSLKVQKACIYTLLLTERDLC